MKKFLSIFLIVLLQLQLVIMCQAENTSNNYENNNNNRNNYINYLSQIDKEKTSESSIFKKAIDYSKSQNADINNGSYAEKEAVLIWNGGSGNVTWEFNVEQAGLYNIKIDYCPLSGVKDTVDIGIKVDDKILFDELKTIKLNRTWTDDGDIRIDEASNEFSPTQKELYKWKSAYITDRSQINYGGFDIYMNEGIHSIEIESLNESFALDKIMLVPTETIPEYNISQDKPLYDGNEIVIQGEKATYKSNKSQIAKSDNTSVNVEPSDAFKSKLNYIGGTNWKTPGEEISWEVNIQESAYYQISFNYRQNYLINSSSYRALKIDGAIPYKAAGEIAFDYTNSWDWNTFGEEQPYFVYLEKGMRTITLEATMGPLCNFTSILDDVVYELGRIYRNIVMITGESPDANRDYNLFKQIPDLEEQLKKNKAILESCIADIDKLNSEKGSSSLSALKNMSGVIDRMLSYKFQTQQYKKSFYDNYCTLSSWLYEFKSMPLDIDKIVLSSASEKPDNAKAGIVKSVIYSLKRFTASFISDYNNISSNNADSKITLWLNWGRDQAKALSFMASNDFTPKTGISVDIKIVNATLVQAILSGNGPDCALEMSRSEPINLAMRGVLYDLSKFDDFDEVKKRFQTTAFVPYEFEGGTYALPDTQIFNIMFYRTDIFKDLNLSVPKTWNEFLYNATVIQRNNMLAAVPYTQITDMNQTNIGIGALNLFPTIMAQNNQSIYTDGHDNTNLRSTEAVNAFEFWTDLYTKYKFPITYDFYNRFRTGTIPMAIAPYNQYAILSAAATEIDGCWSIAPIPGFETNGSINNNETGGGTGCVILEGSENKAAAWEFLKWWTSSEIQIQFANEIESVLGMAARHPTSNIEAFEMLPYDEKDMKVLKQQWERVVEVPEIPGGYYTTRVIDQAFWNTVYQHTNPKDTIAEWSKQADIEIDKKRTEYNLNN